MVGGHFNISPPWLKFHYLKRAILHDSTDYPDPLEFKPDRFLKPGVKDPRTAAFGFGRR